MALARTLTSIIKIDCLPDDFEILVVDNASIDQTRSAFETAHASSPHLNWRYFFEPIPGLLSARHKGALEAAGDVFVFIDDDVRLATDWLSAIKEAFTIPGTALVGGPSQPLYEECPSEWLREFYWENDSGLGCEYLSVFDGGAGVKEIDPMYVWGLNYAIRGDILFKVGGFNPDSLPKTLQRYQGDGETGLGFKIKQAAMRCVYHPQARVVHEVPSARLKPQYFEHRAFFQGVCDSYTSIRRDGCVNKVERNSAQQLRSIISGFSRKMRGSTTKNIRANISAAYARGYAFHQGEVARDEMLLAWVLRQNYWKYDLPDGWRRFLAAK